MTSYLLPGEQSDSLLLQQLERCFLLLHSPSSGVPATKVGFKHTLSRRIYWAIPQYPGHLHREILIFFSKITQDHLNISPGTISIAKKRPF